MNVNGTLFFAAESVAGNSELWKSDGTEAGTLLVKEIRPGNQPSFPTLVANSSGALIFAANDGVNGFELWRSDGTEIGTMLIKDVFAGAQSGTGAFSRNGSQVPFAQINDVVYFVGNDGVSGAELWETDGTAAGTVMVKDVYVGATSSSPTKFYRVGNHVYFEADDGTHRRELWRTDGTAAGTALVKDISTGSSVFVQPLAALDDILLFSRQRRRPRV